MQISELTLKLIIILIPGAIATIIIDKLTIHKEWSPFKFTVNSIIFGVLSYLSLQLVYNSFRFIYNFCSKETLFYENLIVWNTLDDSKSIPYEEVIYSTIFGVIIGAIGSFFENKRLINKLGNLLKLTNKYGHENLYSYFLNKKEIEYVYIRNFKNDIAYLGYVHSFCETDNISEIVLANVSIYTCGTSEFLYAVDEIYLSFVKNEIIIEKAIVVINDNTDKSEEARQIETEEA